MEAKLELFERQSKTPIPEDINSIIEKVSALHGVPKSMLISKKRDAETAWARQLCIWICKKTTTHSAERIAFTFNRDRTSIYSAITAVDERMSTNKRVKEQVEGLLK